jgi:murein DD-endopeptidase MepM/ murein hydrolase activator NlpD
MRVINNKKILFSLLAICFAVSSFLFLSNNVFANDEVNRLSQQISEKERELDAINAEIRRLEASVTNVANRSRTLQNTINELERSKSRITSEISETEAQIKKAELTLSKLALEIDDKEVLIDSNSEALAESVRRMNELESTSLIEKFLGYSNVADFWLDFEQTQAIQKKFHTEVENLNKLYEELQEKESEEIEQKEQLSSYKSELASEQVAVQYTQQEQETVLEQTKNQEAEYQKILAEKKRQREEFEQQLLEIESKLNFLIDVDSYPSPRNGILQWPLDSIVVTQQFGGTAFAKTNPGIYGRPFHPGTDFGVPIGSKVRSVAPGVVIGFGNTDAYPGCVAWGKWIVVEHDNGLTSLYAHLSAISVSNGQKVEAGQVIGLSGNTGFSTGPHLHFTLYASQGVKIGRYGDFKAGTGCSATAATGPFADLDAYLDPMQYLPSL